MAQGMEFRWMGQGPSEDEIARLEAAKNDAEELAQLQKANQNANRAVNWMELGEQLGTSGAYQEAMANQAAQEAQKQADMMRIQELQNKIAERKKAVMNDPRMQIAAMLAMGGQPSALSSMLVSDLQKDIQTKQKKADEKKAAQRELDALENSLSTSMMVLSKTDKDQIDRFKNVTLPIFWNKFHELTDAGAVSRMGGVDAWNNELKQFDTKGKAKSNKAEQDKQNLKTAADNMDGGL
jgi:hypothetical protein